MSTAPTPETDALANGRIGMWQHNLPADFARKLERERDQLQRWKDEQMFVESQWDAQAVGKELGMVAGTDIRRNILPAIVQLKKELQEAHAALSGRTVSCSQCNEATQRADSKHGIWMAELRKVTELEAQIEAMREAIKRANQSLSDLVEHIGECDECQLLKCDIDPHPPSVFSVYADQAKSALIKLKPFLP